MQLCFEGCRGRKISTKPKLEKLQGSSKAAILCEKGKEDTFFLYSINNKKSMHNRRLLPLVLDLSVCLRRKAGLRNNIVEAKD